MVQSNRKIFIVGGQIIGLLVLIPAVALGTLALRHRGADGPSVMFNGGELVSGDLYTGPEPDWSFTQDVGTIELQLTESMTSRLIWIVESEGKAYVVSGYMNSFLGRLWKHWAVEANTDGRAVIRVNGMRYPRQLVRIEQGEALEGVAAELSRKYNSPATRAGIEAGDSWVFELAPAEV